MIVATLLHALPRLSSAILNHQQLFVLQTETVECDEPIPMEDESVAFDLCGEVTTTFTDSYMSIDTCPQGGVITRTYVAEDECGNTNSCTQKIWILDTGIPMLTGIDRVIIQSCEEPTDPEYTGIPIAIDNCDPNPMVTLLGEQIFPGDCPGEYLISPCMDCKLTHVVMVHQVEHCNKASL